MPQPSDPAQLLTQARLRAGLTQRELARKARTAQSVVARIELGQTSPSWKTLMRLCKATGHVLVPTLKPVAADPALLDDVPRILALSPEERLREVGLVSRFVSRARRA